MKKKEKITVEENAKRMLGNTYPTSVSWQQINRISEDVWIRSGKLEYIGAYRDTRGKMCCAFQELIKNANNSYRRGKIFSVDNDVVFEFQEDGKRIERRKFDGGTQG